MYHRLCVCANSLAGSEAWRLDVLHSFSSSLVEQRNDLLAPVPLCHPPFFPSLTLQLPLLSHCSTFPISLSHLPLLRCISGFSADAHFSPRLPVFRSHSLSNPLPPSLSLSFALCVRVCRWLLLAGSVTRENWGRVHFNRTNGNKLIHFHWCFWDGVWIAGKRTDGWGF